MSRGFVELESLLQQLVGEHEKLLRQLDAQQGAMKKLDLKALEESSNQQEATRLRIATLETRRRTVVSQVWLGMKMQGPATLVKVAEAAGAHRENLLALREQLKGLMTQISSRTHLASRLAAGVLGHLNTAVRLLASAVDQPGVYTKHGTQQVTGRIGMLEAVG